MMQPARRFLALGDSYTIGEGVSASDRWPSQLAERLRARGIALEDPVVIARTGFTTDELDALIDSENPTGPFDLVSLLIGVNDQYRGREVESFSAGFELLLRRAIGYTGGVADRVMVLAIPDWGITPFAADRDVTAIARALDAYNATKRELTLKHGARWVDIAPVYRSVGRQLEMLASDGLHPSARMYSLWADAALEEARQAIDG